MSASFLEKLKESAQLGFCITYPAAGIIECIGSDWDWIWIDGQHGELGYNDVLSIVRACNIVKRPAVVRTPGHESGSIGMALDTAAEGLMVPMVENAEQAKAIVEAAKFPPLGSRSWGGRRPIDMRGRKYADQEQPQPVLICQIETENALKNAASIAAVDGVDAIFLSPSDMALRRGWTMDKPRPKEFLDDALKKLAQAALSNGKIAGGVFVTPEALSFGIELGYTYIVSSVDVYFLDEGSKSKIKSLRQCLK